VEACSTQQDGGRHSNAFGVGARLISIFHSGKTFRVRRHVTPMIVGGKYRFNMSAFAEYEDTYADQQA
jgi:hypothetical protein